MAKSQNEDARWLAANVHCVKNQGAQPIAEGVNRVEARRVYAKTVQVPIDEKGYSRSKIYDPISAVAVPNYGQGDEYMIATWFQRPRDDSVAMQYLIPGWKFDNKRPCLVR